MYLNHTTKQEAFFLFLSKKIKEEEEKPFLLKGKKSFELSIKLYFAYS